MNVNGNLINTIPVGAVTTANGANDTQATSATLTDLPGASLSKAFLPNSIPAGGSSALTITIKNTGNTPLTGMGLKDTLPSGLIIANPSGAITNCNDTSTPTLTAVPGTALIQLASGSMPGSTTCTVQVNVTTTSTITAGGYQNCIPVNALTDDQGAQNHLQACDTLAVTDFAALGDYVWNDANANGIQDGGETGIAGVTVTLYGSDGTTVIGTPTTTAADGSYHFTNLAPGTYYVGFTKPTGYVFSPQYATGSTTSNDSNASTTTNPTTLTNMSGPITITAGETDDTIDAGLYKPVMIGDFVWNDANANGIQDTGETGIQGVTLTLNGTSDAGTTITDTATTDLTGHYLFTEVPGTYNVSIDAANFNSGNALHGYTASPTGKGTTSTDSNPSPSGTTPTDLTPGGSSDLTVDFGYYQKVMIGDFVWNDANANGIQDTGETGIQGVTLTLNGTSDAGTTITDTATTDSTGHYLFTEVPGTYNVSIDAANFNSGNALHGYTASPTGKGTTSTDSNPSPSGTTPTDLTPGGSSDLTVDFGYYQKVMIGDFVWNDANANGIQDTGETGIQGVTLTLNGTSDAGTTITDTATTDSTGHYLFTEVPGTYNVSIDAANFNSGNALHGYTASPTGKGTTSTDSNPSPSGTTPTDLTPGGSSDLTVDFGYYNPATLAALGDFVWDDANVNGIQDSSEKGIPNVVVNLLGPTGTTVLATTKTDANGNYSFINLVPGTYRVQFVKPAGYSFSPQYAPNSTTSNDSNANTTSGITDAVTLTAGETDNTIDAGLWQPAPNLFDPPYGVKVLSATGLPELEWQMNWINNANVAAINVQIADPIPAGTTYVLNSLTCVANGASTTTSCIYDSVLNRIFWQGTIASDFGVTDPKNAINKIVITFSVTVLNGVNNVNNQGSSLTDTNGNGSFTDETTSSSVSASNIVSWSRNGSGGGGGGGINPGAQLPSTGFAPGVTTSIAPEPANMYDASSDLTIEIPALGVKTAIVGVPQSGSTWDITWLGNDVGYLDGTAYPTLSGNSVLTGHVYGADGLPGPFVNLSTLKWGDQIIIHFAGQRYIYEVRENNIISPSNTSVFKHEDQPWLNAGYLQGLQRQHQYVQIPCGGGCRIDQNRIGYQFQPYRKVITQKMRQLEKVPHLSFPPPDGCLTSMGGSLSSFCGSLDVFCGSLASLNGSLALAQGYNWQLEPSRSQYVPKHQTFTFTGSTRHRAGDSRCCLTVRP